MGAEECLVVFDTVEDAYVRFDSEFRLTFANLAAERFFGGSRAASLGKSLDDLFPEIAGTPLGDAYRRAMSERAAVTLENYRETEQKWYSITASPDADHGIVVRFSDVTDRKRIELGIRKSEEKFFKAFQSSPVPMSLVDVGRNNSFLEVNQSFERITGFHHDEIIGRTAAELGLHVNPRDFEESKKRLLADGGYRNLEFSFRKKNGEIIIGLLSAEQIEIDGSSCAIAVAVDVTESRRAEQAHRESEELYRQLFELESDAIVLVDRESGQLLAANQAASNLYGYTREELLSMNRTDLSAEPEKTIEATVHMRTFIPLRWHRKKNGTVFPVEISGSYFEFKGRSVFVSAIRDITNRKLIKEALEKSEEKFSKAFHSNPAAIVITDLTDQCYIEVNHTFEHLVGYRRDEIVGHTWAELPLWTDPNLRDHAVTHLMRDGSIRNWECRFRRKNGDEGTGLLSAELIEVDGKQCAITSTVDITERIHLQSQLGQAQKLESVGRLAGGVAHDFNNLLTIINGYGDLILKALPADHPLHSYAHEICKAGAHAVGLTGQLLAFSRKQVIEPSALEVNTIVNDTVVMLRRLIGEDISLTTSLDPSAGQVMADGHQLHQIIMNLAVNARDAMPDGGRLNIATSNADVAESDLAAHPDARAGKYVVMSVTDSGVGMDQETLQHAFEPFFTTKERGKGTGLGLSTVYGIVRQSGGWIDAWSEVGRGSSFKIYMPRIDAGPPEPKPEASVNRSALRGGETVLVVEDQEAVRELTKTVLEAYGYRVFEATNGNEALAFVNQHPDEIHLLLTDVILPGMNGKELSERLRRLRPNIKVLFTSGHTAEVVGRRGVTERDLAYLPKPVSPETLVAKVRDVLG
jgi:PAS domain S-box-containing protein